MSCQAGYDSFSFLIIEEYINVDLVFNKRVVRFHTAAPFISMVCFFLWFVTNTVCFVVDYIFVEINTNTKEARKPRIHMFKDKKYDSDAATENEDDDDRHYEINRVIFND